MGEKILNESQHNGLNVKKLTYIILIYISMFPMKNGLYSKNILYTLVCIYMARTKIFQYIIAYGVGNI